MTTVPPPGSVPRRTFVPLNVPVNFVSTAIRAVPMVHPQSPTLQVAARLLTNGFLHREIREKGGAYGGGAFFDSAEGCFGFYSYRYGPVVTAGKTRTAADHVHRVGRCVSRAFSVLQGPRYDGHGGHVPARCGLAALQQVRGPRTRIFLFFLPDCFKT